MTHPGTYKMTTQQNGPGRLRRVPRPSLRRQKINKKPAPVPDNRAAQLVWFDGKVKKCEIAKRTLNTTQKEWTEVNNNLKKTMHARDLIKTTDHFDDTFDNTIWRLIEEKKHIWRRLYLHTHLKNIAEKAMENASLAIAQSPK